MLTTKAKFEIDECGHAEIAEKMFLLRRAQVFSCLDDDTLLEISCRLQTLTFAEGDAIITQGALDRDIFILKSGSVEVVADGRPLANLSAGSVFGEMAPLEPSPRSATVRALEPSCAYRLPADTFLALLEERPELATTMISLLCERIRQGLKSPKVPIASSSNTSPRSFLVDARWNSSRCEE